MSTTEFLSITEDTQEFFYSILEQASTTQQLLLSPHLLDYLSSVLSHYGQGHSLNHKKSFQGGLSSKYAQALGASSTSKRLLLKQVAEETLYSLGFFTPFFKNQILGVNYYMQLGAYSYKNLSDLEPSEEHKEVFSYCADNFSVFLNLFYYISKQFAYFSKVDSKE